METSLVSRSASRAAVRFHRPFRTAAVLGAGTMGAQIAAHLANAGLRVLLLDLPSKDDGRDRDAVARRGLAQATKMKPDPFFTKETAARITVGNFEDDFERLREVDWIIEAVVERLDVKQALHERIEAVLGDDAVVSTNTSGLRIADIAAGRSEAFRRRFLGTHFFNPPRYLKLLELVPSEATDPDVIDRVAAFGRIHLGKGIVVARDTPYFIGNRIGVYAMAVAMRRMASGEYTIEEIDTLTGPLLGRPKSGTFRTADVVGLDVLLHVARNLHEAVPEDEQRDVFLPPDLLVGLVERGALGQKTGAGFYRKDGREIRSIDPATGTYEPAKPMDLGDLSEIQRQPLPDRLRSLFDDTGRAGDFVRDVLLDVMAYSARRIPEIADRPADVDRALRWGFGWELGPFETWDVLGFERVYEAMQQCEAVLPDWVHALAAVRNPQFYRAEGDGTLVYVPSEARYLPMQKAADELGPTYLARDTRRTLWENEESALVDLGEGVALFEFRSKANTLGQRVMKGLVESIDRVERDPDLCGLVVGNEGKHFSAGANLAEMAPAFTSGRFDEIERYLVFFQEAVQRVRYASKPVVVAAHQRVLGGACELVLACPIPVASAESYIGLVELGVGLIPAGTGSTRLAALAGERSPGGHPSEIQPWLQRFYENVAMARVSTSAREAQEMGYLPGHAPIVMHDDRRLFVARGEVLARVRAGYVPPPRRPVRVLGRPTAAAVEVMLQQYVEGGFISAYDLHLGRRLAYVMTGGELTAPQDVDEDYLLGLEREVFLSLLGEPKTQERIVHLLTNNRPLRN